MIESIYAKPGLYDSVLPQYVFDGKPDEELLDDELARIFTEGAEPRILELGCGTGRMTTILRRHGTDLTCLDNSEAMLGSFRLHHPDLTPICADAREHIVSTSGEYDLVAAFWSLSYPILSCFEHNNGRTVTALDPAVGLEQAEAFLTALLNHVAPGGYLLAFFFDDDSPEQRLITKLWERIAPFPGEGRGYTRTLLLKHLDQQVSNGRGEVSHRRYEGFAHATNLEQAQRYMLEGHLRNFPGLADQPDVQEEVHDFLTTHRQPDGTVDVPAGLHIIRYTRIDQ